MDDLYNELEKILVCELDIHNSAADAAASLNKSIRENSISDIQTFTIRHDEQICQIEKLEVQRIEYSIQIGRKLGLKMKVPRLASLIENAPENRRAKLSEIHIALKNKVFELSRQTVSNQLLLENAMNVINCTLTFVRKAQNKYEPYGSKKKTGHSFQAYSLINRTV